MALSDGLLQPSALARVLRQRVAAEESRGQGRERGESGRGRQKFAPSESAPSASHSPHHFVNRHAPSSFASAAANSSEPN